MNIKDSYIHNGTAVLKDIQVNGTTLQKKLAGKDSSDAYLDWVDVLNLTTIKATNAVTADKLGTNAGSALNPVYFSNGIPVASNGNTIPFYSDGTGEAAKYVDSKYYSNKWVFNKTITPTDGTLILIKVPLTGNDYGITLSLDNGTTYHPIVLINSGRLTDHFKTGVVILLVYEPGSSSSEVYAHDGSSSRVKYDGVWRVVNYYNSNDYPWFIRTYTIKAAESINSARIIGGTDNGYKNLVAGTTEAPVTFDIRYPVLYSGAAISSGSTGNYNFDINYSVSKTACADISFTAYKAIYLKGTISGNIFTVDNTNPYVQDITATDNNSVYYYIGRAYSTSSFSFNAAGAKMYWYKDGAIRPYSYYTVSAGKLTTNAGSSTQPIYFSNGVPVAITGAIANDTTGSAASIKTITRSTNANHYLTFVDSDNSSATAETLYTDAGIYYNPSSNTLNIGGDLHVGSMLYAAIEATSLKVTGSAIFNNLITGSISGNAGTATKLASPVNITVGSKTNSFDGSSAITFSLTDIGVAAASHGIHPNSSTVGYVAYYSGASEVSGTSLLQFDTTNGYTTVTGLLKVTKNKNTITIGSQNESWCHIYNSADIPFIFNKTVASTSGDLGTSGYAWGSIYLKTSTVFKQTNYKGTLNVATLTADRTWTLPDAGGTIALTSSNITGSSAKWATARTLTIGNTGKSVDGSSNVSWTLNEIGAQAKIEIIDLR